MSQYTETERAALKGAFLQAKRRLARHLELKFGDVFVSGADGKARYICQAIERAEKEGFVNPGISGLARRIILDRMGCYSFELWIKTKSGVPLWDIEADMDRNKGRKLQATRHAWVDALILEFSV